MSQTIDVRTGASARAGLAGVERRGASERRVSWLVAALFAGATAAAFGGGGKVVSLGFPAAAVGLAVFLRRHHPTAYLTLCWWSWLLVPELRRVIDWRSGWSPADPVMLAPPLVTAVGAVTILRHLRGLQTRQYRPFILAICGLAAAYAVGMLRVGIPSATYGLFDWAAPVVVALHAAIEARRSDAVARTVRRVVGPSVVVLGVYGVIQWTVLPPWDKSWIEQSGIVSVGYPRPQGFRVFSTLNSPQPYACVLLSLLLVAAAIRIPWRLPVYVIGISGLALSLVRSAWIGGVVGLVVGLALPRLQSPWTPRKAIVAQAVIIVGVMAVILTGGGVVTKRLDTIAHLSHDDSFVTRVRFYRSTALTAVLEPLGHGVGSTGTATKLATADNQLGANGNFDSGVMEIPLVLGWLGGLLYVGGLVAMIRFLFRRTSVGRWDLAARAVVVGGVVQLVGSNVLTGVIGVFILLPVGMSVGGGDFPEPAA